MKRLCTKGIALFLTVMLVPAVPVAASATDAQKHQQELQRIQQQKNQVTKIKKENERQQRDVSSKINGLESQIQTIENQISGLNGRISQTTSDIERKAVELQKAETGISNKKVTIDSRLRVMYKTGTVGYLEVLLGASDFKDLLSRIDAVRKIYEHDTNLIRYMIDQKNLIAKTKQELESRKASYRQLVGEKASAQAAMNGKVDELEVTKKQLIKDHVALAAQEAKLQADADSVTRMLQSMKLGGKYVGGSMSWPVPGRGKITQSYGYSIHPILKKKLLHTGLDIGVPSGSNVVAAQSGTVIFAGWKGGYGKTVMIDHGGGIVTLYAHNSSLLVDVGAKVSRGGSIAASGSTGLSTGPHVHFEVRVNGQYVDPLKYVSP